MTRRLLLLAPSVGFGGGIERNTRQIEAAWPGPVERVNLYQRDRDRGAEGSLLAKARFSAAATGRALRSRPDVILAMHIGLLPTTLVAAGLTRARAALLGHGTEVWMEMGRVRRAMLRRCDPIACVSTYSAEWLARRARMDPAQLPVLSPAIDPELAELVRSAEPERTREPVLLTVSRIARAHRYKGHFAVAEALPDVLEHRQEARWVVAGDGDDLAALDRRCRELGISDSVELRGRISDQELVGLYRSASALVLPSIADATVDPPIGEGFGLVYAEAGAFGLPSIASSALGGARDFVIDGETGMTVPRGDAAGLAKAMRALLDDAGLRQRLGEAARARALANHMPEGYAQKVQLTFRVD